MSAITDPTPNGHSQQYSNALYVKSFIFGSEDSLVSTVGLLSGVAVAGVAKADIVVAGIILIFVEALSMAVGDFLSENSAEEYLTRSEAPVGMAVRAGTIMFFSYFILGLVPLAPYLWLSVQTAFWWSIGASLVSLFLLGYESGRRFHVNRWVSAAKMFFLGGAAILIGVIVGRIVQR